MSSSVLLDLDLNWDWNLIVEEECFLFDPPLPIPTTLNLLISNLREEVVATLIARWSRGEQEEGRTNSVATDKERGLGFYKTA